MRITKGEREGGSEGRSVPFVSNILVSFFALPPHTPSVALIYSLRDFPRYRLFSPPCQRKIKNVESYTRWLSRDESGESRVTLFAVSRTLFRAEYMHRADDHQQSSSHDGEHSYSTPNCVKR